MTTLISNPNLSIKLGAKTILEDTRIVLNTNTKYGLVGPNGCGKTSLINWIVQELITNQSIQPYVVDQHIQIDDEKQTVIDYMLRADPLVYQINKQVLELESKEMTDQELELYTELTSSSEYSSYSAYLSESKKILKGLGIVNYEYPVSFYSGGWRMRLTIARSLISKPNVLIMDEPTNHLDLNAVIWLSNYLVGWKKTLIVVSHQIDFLNEFVDVFWYIGSPDFKEPKLYTATRSYSNLQKTLSDISKAACSAYSKFESELESMKKCKKGKKPATKAELDEFIKKKQVPRPPKDYEVKITFPQVFLNTTKSIITFDNVDFSYSELSDPIILDVNLSIGLESRYVIVGPNGVGKTTLFKLCEGLIEPTRGSVFRDSRVKIGYYNQQVASNLPLNLTPLEYLKALKPEITIEQSRACLSKLGLKRIESADPCVIPIEKLSGGQKARVSFASLQIQEPNIILLDEPTNHLDIESIEGLIQGINDYEGGIVIITHDVYVISQIDNCQILEVCAQTRKVKRFNGQINDYVSKIINDL
jgi:ATP-binding cassette subfamily F protein 1